MRGVFFDKFLQLFEKTIDFFKIKSYLCNIKLKEQHYENNPYNFKHSGFH